MTHKEGNPELWAGQETLFPSNHSREQTREIAIPRAFPTLILEHARCNAWPLRRPWGWARHVSLPSALTGVYKTDAHFVAYYVPDLARRLSKEALGAIDAGVTLGLWCLDIDCPSSHKSTGGDGKQIASDEWWFSQLAKIQALDQDHPGLFAYRTRGGARIVYLCRPFTIRTKEDAESWTLAYVRLCVSLATLYGLHCDPQCADWQHLYRLPHATRDVAPEQLDLFGDPQHIRSMELPYVPERDDETARQLAALYPKSWAPKLRTLGITTPRVVRTFEERQAARVAKDTTPAPEGSRHQQLVTKILAISGPETSYEQRLTYGREINSGFSDPKEDKEVVGIVEWSIEKKPHVATVVTGTLAHASAQLAGLLSAPVNGEDILAIASPTALGKTHLLVLEAIAQANAGRRVIIALLNLRLLFEFKARLEAEMSRQNTTLPISVHRSLGTVRGPHGSLACIHADKIPPLSAAGLFVDRTLCQPKNQPKCSNFDTCLARETVAVEQEKGMIALSTHASLPQVLGQYTTARVIFDELPECFESHSLPIEAMTTEHLDLFRGSYKEACEELFIDLYKHWESNPVEPVRLESVLRQSTRDKFTALRAEQGADQTLAPLLTAQSAQYASAGMPDVLRRIEKFASVIRSCEAILHHNLPSSLLLDAHAEERLVLVRPSHLLMKVQQSGRQVTVLSADAETLANKIAFPTLRTRTETVTVKPEIKHDIQWFQSEKSMAKKAVMPHGVVSLEALARMVNLVRRLSKDWAGAGASTGLIVSRKAVVDRLGEITAPGATLGTQLERWIAWHWKRLPVTYALDHFPIAGTDAYRERHCLIVLGDHLLPVSEAEARASLTGLTTSQVMEQEAIAATRQAIGRLRGLRADRVQHYAIVGRYCPPEAIAEVVAPLTYIPGPVPTADPLLAQELETWRQLNGYTQGEAAEKLGVTRSTYARWLACDQGVPGDILELVR